MCGHAGARVWVWVRLVRKKERLVKYDEVQVSTVLAHLSYGSNSVDDMIKATTSGHPFESA